MSSGSGRLSLVLVLSLGVLAGCAGRREERHVAPESKRTLPAGEVVGFAEQYGGHAWLGIPYAHPPVGDLRWRAPRAPGPWTGTREALRPGSPCMQYTSKFAGVEGRAGATAGSEDCLYLNVYAPRFSPQAVPRGEDRLPVMVWVHGGGNTIGRADFYNGGNLAASQRVIVVTTNYRLGPFGWFRHRALREGTGALDASGNFGTLDLIRALEWVRDNISAFGGDPGRVTIFGESAGGQNVYQLLVSPLSRGLFHRAIVQSGGMRFAEVDEAEGFVGESPTAGANGSDEVLLRLLIADGRASDRNSARALVRRMSAPEIAAYLRGTRGDILLGAYEALPTGMIEMPRVFRDGTVLPLDAPQQRLTAGQYNRVPVILGTNRDENKLFLFGVPELVKRYFWIVPRLRDPRWYNLAAEYQSRMWKATGVDEPAAAMRAVQGADVFAYRFDWDEEPVILGADLAAMLGAAHGFEIPFVFGHFDLGKEGNVIFTRENEPGRKTLSAQMMSYWTQFAATGNPGRGRDGKLPEWKPWAEGEGEKYMLFDTPAGGGLKMASATESRAALLAAVATDARFADQRERCRMLRDFVVWGHGALTKEEYSANAACRAFPLEEYPWRAHRSASGG